ncbi:sigma-70 family RNA polymerase sigma factor [Dactylosporangium sp. NPDC049525]|uniref:RNA polymerase sigma factor n=1 Tax=Dactylosporangium sp. NPDC049525 TaxID=3154730 RepID=UPI003432B2D3
MDDANDRDTGWFRAVYDRHYADVVRYGLRRLDTSAASAAEELAQEVFLVAWRRRWDVPSHALPWLYGVARRLLANHWRAQRAAPPPVELGERPATDRHDGVDQLLDVRAALTRLSDDDQEILRLVAWEQLAVGEAALVLGCGVTAAKVRLHRARRRLTELLADTPTPARLGGTR